ncbi:MAG TPA: hypothetical protein PLG03_06915 [Bacteroidales bacterium]|nr:hypothetical protein [Bacteroidales bacterium]HRR49956.1 hypothetical protein [Bacteroidales bacterium]
MKTLYSNIALLEMEALFENRKIYLKSEITPSLIADLLKIKRRRLEGIVNNSFGLSIDNIVNMYRLQYARQLLISGEKYDSLWEKSGFSSRVDMERAFENIVV